MSQNKVWKSTKDGSQPTGRKVKGTLKDISLVHCFPRFIEAVDLESQKQGKPRSEVLRKVQRETRDIDFSLPERDATSSEEDELIAKLVEKVKREYGEVTPDCDDGPT